MRYRIFIQSPLAVAVALTTLLRPSLAHAQDAPPRDSAVQETRCDGRVISVVEFRRASRTIIEKQGAPGWLRAILKPLLLGSPTRGEAVAPYMQLHDGDTCTELHRAESERLLRALPYIADASVRAVDDADGRVRIVVETVDDIRPIIGGGLRSSRLSNAEFGNSNIAGAGILTAIRWRDGFAFRDGYGVRFADYRLFGGPNVAQFDVERAPIGSSVQASVGRPFFSDFQHTAGYLGYVRDDGYESFVRPEGDPLSVRTVRERADAGLSLRLNPRGRVSMLLGALASLERRKADGNAVIVRDTAVIDTTDAALTGRYAEQRSTRVGVVFGIRALSFAKVRAFDGLEGAQDVARGMQIATTVGKGVGGLDRREFVTTDFYVGAGTATTFVGFRTLLEVRHNAGGWGDGVASGRLAWYGHPSDRRTRIISLEYVGSSTDSVPYQITMSDAQTGLRGYTGSRLAGGRRAIGRIEQRFILPGVSTYLGWGLAGFVEGGGMWAAKVPFGATGYRSSVGVSLLTAVPRESRSVARVDVAYPLVKDVNAKGVDIRVTYSLTGRSFWREPSQISRARQGTPTTDIFAWP